MRARFTLSRALLLASAAVALAVAGLGCGGSLPPFPDTPFTGSFSGTIATSDGGTGVFVGYIQQNAVMNWVATTTTIGEISGTGNVNELGQFAVETTVDSVTIYISGQLATAPEGFTGAGTLQTTTGVTGTVNFESTTGVSPFVGNYSGTYTGTTASGPVSGTITATINSAGAVTFSASQSSGGTDVSGTGLVAGTGEICVTTGTAPNPTGSGVGLLTASDSGVTGEGTWQSADGGSGTWTMVRN